MSLDYVTEVVKNQREIEPPRARYCLRVHTHSEMLRPETQTHPDTDSTTIHASTGNW